MPNILNFCGWEDGEGGEASIRFGVTSVQSAVKRSGDFAARVTPDGGGDIATNEGYYRFRKIDAAGYSNTLFDVPTAYSTFYWRYDVGPTSGDEPIYFVADVAGQAKFELRLGSDGKLAAYGKSVTLLATGATVLADLTFYEIEVKVGTGIAADWEVKINGVSEISGVADLTASNVGSIYVGKWMDRNSNALDMYYDDFCVADDAYPGAGRVIRMDADGDGTYVAWAGDYTDVNDDPLPQDGDATFIRSVVAGQVETVTLESAAAAGLVGTPLAVKSVAIVRDEAGASALQVRLRSGATNSDTDSSNVWDVYSLRARVYNADPADAAVWTEAKLDALQVGVENNAAVAVRCTALWVMVWEDGVAGVAPQTLTPAPFAIPIAAPAPIVALTNTIAPTPVTTPVVISEPTLLLTTILTLAPVLIPIAIPEPTIRTGGTFSPEPVVVPLAVPTPTLILAYTLTPNPVDVPLGLPAPTIVLALRLMPSAVAILMVLPAPTIAAAGVIAPNPVVIILTIPDPAISVSGELTPSPVAIPLAIPAPVLTRTLALTPAAAGVVTAIPTPTLLLTNSLTPAAIAIPLVSPAPLIIYFGSIWVTPGSVAILMAVPTPLVLGGGTPAPVVVAVGSWRGYSRIIQEAIEIEREERSRPLVDCPICGTPLEHNVTRGLLNCSMGHYRASVGTTVRSAG